MNGSDARPQNIDQALFRKTETTATTVKTIRTFKLLRLIVLKILDLEFYNVSIRFMGVKIGFYVVSCSHRIVYKMKTYDTLNDNLK